MISLTFESVMKRIFNRILVLAGLGAALSSCSFLEVEPHVICSETFYNSASEVQYGLAGVYGVMSNEQLYGNFYSVMCSNVDDLCYFNREQSNNLLQFQRHSAGTSQIYDIWIELYQGINNANAFMEAVVKTDFDKDGAAFNEARFLRAYYHFLLAQAWGNVPLRTSAVVSPSEVMIAATPQYEVLKWAADEMEACVAKADTSLVNAPSRITRTTVQGILSRVYLFMAGATVGAGDAEKTEYLTNAMNHAFDVIDSEKHQLNPDYSEVFKNMIMDKYDTKYYESMWEVDFLGDRSSAENWSNGRIGDVIGLQSTGDDGYQSWNCNYSYGQYDGSLKLWDLYWSIDRTADESELPVVTDKRQEWNMPPYNYAGNEKYPPYGSGLTSGKSLKGIDKAPYVYDNVSTSSNPLAAPAIRNCGKYRREVIYEGQKTAKLLYTTINYPLLRYSDVLLMYAEASNELNGVTQAAYDCVKAVRDRAGVKTNEMASYDQEAFRQLVRNERGRELCFESLRKYDLIRWGIYVSEMNNYTLWTADERWANNAKAERAASMGSYVKPMHVVLPIPSIELGVNDKLVQNPLW